jgi:hypothetical protein
MCVESVEFFPLLARPNGVLTLFTEQLSFYLIKHMVFAR